MKILMLSAYDAASHRYWRQGLVDNFPHYCWQVLNLPGRYFNWRIRGNPLSWNWTKSNELAQSYDLIIATSMVDLATIKGLNPNLANTPSIVYFHENQFIYPDSKQQLQCAEPKMVNLYSAICADKLLFNSDFNRQSFFQGSEQFLYKMPDFAPKNLATVLDDKSQVLPVPLNNDLFAIRYVTKKNAQLTLLWNHRWEYDKGPEGLYALLRELDSMRVDFKIHIIGQSFRRQPSIMQKIKEHFTDYIDCFGYIENKTEYYQLLQQSHLALSTSIHEFQGLAVMEAVSQGCLPVVPNRLSYQEIFSSQFRYQSSNDKELEARQMARMIANYANINDLKISGPDMWKYSWEKQKSSYEQVIESFKPPS